MAFYNSKQREQYLRYCAGQLDWKFEPDGDKTMLKWLLDFKLFKNGGKKRIKPLIIKEHDDLSFTSLFDYQYTVSTGKSSYTFRQTVYFRYSKRIALPYFIMVPEKWYHRIGNYFGMQDIDFAEYPIFSKNYLLQGADEHYIRHHFDHPEMVRFFDRNKKYSLEGVNYLMVLYQHNVVLKEKEILRLVETGNRLHNYFTEKTPEIELPAE